MTNIACLVSSNSAIDGVMYENPASKLSLPSLFSVVSAPSGRAAAASDRDSDGRRRAESASDRDSDGWHLAESDSDRDSAGIWQNQTLTVTRTDGAGPGQVQVTEPAEGGCSTCRCASLGPLYYSSSQR